MVQEEEKRKEIEEQGERERAQEGKKPLIG
jgi:hypothetical protein